ncbi:MAG: 16S rRNA (cytosine(967)-C(5))-methyltransferase, partial [Gammaproteobacteria bacterium]|nr:16S rRNA (cytosine(967)-C(5))-methyltransferase [Gammaproteobacteria bacterium]
PGLRVLDACAAPGGKTCHMLEAEPRLRELVAIDIQPDRLEKIGNSLSRLGLKASTIAADVSDTGAWWDGRKFDRILLDAPCSATGVIRRHPDIKVLRSIGDVTRVVEQQGKLLRSVWPLLAVGGKLVYATCSILKRENDGVVGRFIQEETGARIEHIESEWGYEAGAGRQILPGQHDFDGFYYACLYKQSETG